LAAGTVSVLCLMSCTSSRARTESRNFGVLSGGLYPLFQQLRPRVRFGGRTRSRTAQAGLPLSADCGPRAIMTDREQTTPDLRVDRERADGHADPGSMNARATNHVDRPRMTDPGIAPIWSSGPAARRGPYRACRTRGGCAVAPPLTVAASADDWWLIEPENAAAPMLCSPCPSAYGRSN